MKMVRDKVLVEVDKSTGSSVIILTDPPKIRGTVLAVGPGTKDDPMLLQPGQRVQFFENAGTPLPYDDKEYLVLREAEVIAIL